MSVDVVECEGSGGAIADSFDPLGIMVDREADCRRVCPGVNAVDNAA